MAGTIRAMESQSTPGDISFQLSGIKEYMTESFSIGSSVSVDSFIQVSKLQDDDDDDVRSFDPYLDGLHPPTRKNNGLEGSKDRSSTPTTVPINVDTSDSSASTTGDRLAELPVLKIEIPKQRTTMHTCTVGDRSKTSQALLKAQHERTYWKNIISSRLQQHAVAHPSSADALMQLGHAHARCGEYDQALCAYKSALGGFRKLYGQHHLSVAAALNKVGLITFRFSEKEASQTAMKALMQSFALRHSILGPTHVDTVESLNTIAAVHMHLYEYQPARKAYYEVFSVRKALWGKYHPSVGVVAQALGSVHLQLAELRYADKFFRIAMEVYRRNNLGPDNPTMKKLKAEMEKMERVLRLNTGSLVEL